MSPLRIDRLHAVKPVNAASGDVHRRIQKDEGIPVACRKEVRASRKLFLNRPDTPEHIGIEYAAKLASTRIALAKTLDIIDEETAEVSASSFGSRGLRTLIGCLG